MERDTGNTTPNPNRFGPSQGASGNAGGSDQSEQDPLGEPSPIEEMQQKHRSQMLGMPSMPNQFQNLLLQQPPNRGMGLMGWAAASSGIPQTSMAPPSAAAAMNQSVSSSTMFSSNIMQQLQIGQQQRLDAATQLASLHPFQQPQQQQQQLQQHPSPNTQSLQQKLQQLQQLQQVQLLQQQQQLMNISHTSAGSDDDSNSQAAGVGNMATFLDPNQSSETLLLQLQLQQLRQQHQSLMAQQQQQQQQARMQSATTNASTGTTPRLDFGSVDVLQMQSNAASAPASFLTSTDSTSAASASAASSQALHGANSASPPGFLGKIPAQDFSTTMEDLQQLQQQQQQQHLQQQSTRPDPSGSFSNQNSLGFFDAWTSSAMPLGTQILPGGAPAPQDASTSILKPLSAYNYFFTEERERLLHGENRFGDETIEARKMRLLSRHWSKDRNKRRPHRKTHGKISFTTLSKHIGQKWRELDETEKNFYKNVAKADMARYKEELAKRDREIAQESTLKNDEDGE